MAAFSIFDTISNFLKPKTVQATSGQMAIGPVPTPNVPQGMSYTPQASPSKPILYNGPGFGPNYNPPVNPVNQTGGMSKSIASPGSLNQTPSGKNGGSNGGSNGGNSGAPTSYLDQLMTNEQKAYQDRLNAAQSNYDRLMETYNNQKSDLTNQKDSLLNQIGSTYTNVKQQAKDTLAKNLAALDQGKTTVTQGYDNLKTEQSRLLGDTQLRNRQMARALGDLNSSNYENNQSKAASDTQAAISGIGQQEQSQLDQIGQQITSQNLDANTKLQSLDEAQAQAETSVLSKYQSAAQQIATDQKYNEVDRANALESINTSMQSALDNIGLTIASYKQQASGLGSVANPLKDISALLSNLSTINKNLLNPLQIPAQAANLAQQAFQSGSNWNDIAGYINFNAPNKDVASQALQEALGLVQQNGAQVSYGSNGTPTVNPPKTGILGLGGVDPSYYSNLGNQITPQQVPDIKSLLTQLGYSFN